MKIALLTNKEHHKNDINIVDSGLYSAIKIMNSICHEDIKEYLPNYIFVLHWSEYIPKSIFENYETIIFHMTDLPYGRGGSPLQNLITRGHKSTTISAIRCTDKLDAGDIYHKVSLDLHGNAQEILERASVKIMKMINFILENKPNPTPQKGEVVLFKRRTPNESNIAFLSNINKIYDYIRMLDGEGYPPAFLETQNVRIEFSGAKLTDNTIDAKVKVCLKEY